MRDPDRVNAVVAEWVLKAENDLMNAAHTLKLREQVRRTASVFTHGNAWRNASKDCWSILTWTFATDLLTSTPG